MVSDITSRRVPWVALALSLLSAGVGHLYCGRIAKGLPLYFAWLLVPIGITIAALLPPSPTAFVLLVLLPVVVVFIVYLYAAIDAWRLASRIGSDHSLRDYNRAAIYSLLIVVQMIYSIGLIAGVRGWVYEAFRDSEQQHESDLSSRRPHPGEKTDDARSRSQTWRLDRV